MIKSSYNLDLCMLVALIVLISNFYIRKNIHKNVLVDLNAIQNF